MSVELESQVRDIAKSESEMVGSILGVNSHDDQYDRRNAADLEQYGAFNGTIG